MTCAQQSALQQAVCARYEEDGAFAALPRPPQTGERSSKGGSCKGVLPVRTAACVMLVVVSVVLQKRCLHTSAS